MPMSKWQGGAPNRRLCCKVQTQVGLNFQIMEVDRHLINTLKYDAHSESAAKSSLFGDKIEKAKEIMAQISNIKELLEQVDKLKKQLVGKGSQGERQICCRQKKSAGSRKNWTSKAKLLMPWWLNRLSSSPRTQRLCGSFQEELEVLTEEQTVLNTGNSW